MGEKAYQRKLQMDKIKKYDIGRSNVLSPNCKVFDLKPYFEKNRDHNTIPHRHSYFQILWFDSPGRHHVDFKDYQHDENSIFLINKDQVHYFCTDSTNAGVAIHFNEDFLVLNEKNYDGVFYFQLFNDYNSPCQKITEEQSKPLLTYRQQLAQEYHHFGNMSERALYLNLQLLLIHLYRYKIQAGNVTPKASQEKWELFFAFRRLIAEQIDQMLTVDYLAQQLFVDKKTLSNLTRNLVNKSPGQILAETKIIEAKRLLSNTSNAVKEVAFALGFDQPTYFTKYFKKHTQQTPKEFVAGLL